MRRRTRRKTAIPTNKKIKKCSLGQMLFSSILGMVVCAVCLVGLTMAWFSASVERTSGELKTSNFVIDVRVEYEKDGSWQSVEQSGVSYSLEAGKTYTVTLTGQPDLGLGSGYGIFTLSGGAEGVEGAEATYVTDALKYGDSGYNAIEFQIMTNVPCELKIGCGWGASGAEEVVADGAEVEFYSPIQAAIDASAEEAPPAEMSDPQGTEGLRVEEGEFLYAPEEEFTQEDDFVSSETEPVGSGDSPVSDGTEDSETVETEPESDSAPIEPEDSGEGGSPVSDETADSEASPDMSQEVLGEGL